MGSLKKSLNRKCGIITQGQIIFFLWVITRLITSLLLKDETVEPSWSSMLTAHVQLIKWPSLSALELNICVGEIIMLISCKVPSTMLSGEMIVVGPFPKSYVVRSWSFWTVNKWNMNNENSKTLFFISLYSKNQYNSILYLLDIIMYPNSIPLELWFDWIVSFWSSISTSLMVMSLVYQFTMSEMGWKYRTQSSVLKNMFYIGPLIY